MNLCMPVRQPQDDGGHCPGPLIDTFRLPFNFGLKVHSHWMCCCVSCCATQCNTSHVNELLWRHAVCCSENDATCRAVPRGTPNTMHLVWMNLNSRSSYRVRRGLFNVYILPTSDLEWRVLDSRCLHFLAPSIPIVCGHTLWVPL